MKKFLKVFLVLSMMLSLVSTFTLNTKASDEVKFVNEYEKVGQAIEIDTSMLSGNISYEWSIDGIVVSTQTSYTPKANDINKLIYVKVTSADTETTLKTFLSDLPVVYIDIENGASVTSKDVYLNSQLTIQGNDKYNQETTKLYSGACEIKGRGNSTWGFPKKPYRLKLDKKTDLFGFGKNKHFVLLANYNDTTFLRNKLGYDLSGTIGMPYMQSVLVDVVMNGQYIGNYQLCEHVRIDEKRIDITDWESIGEDGAAAIVEGNNLSDDDLDALEEMMVEDLSWVDSGNVTYNNVTYKVSDYIEVPDITGGYFLEMDKYYDEISKFQTNDGHPIMFKSPEYANTSTSMMNYVKTYIQAFEDSLKSYNYSAIHEGKSKHYSELFDIDSIVDAWIVQELFLNADYMKNSTYFYKDHDELFKMGPIWDLDWTCGVEYSSSVDYTKWQVEIHQDQWFTTLFKDPYFMKLAQDRYLEVRDSAIQDMYDSIDSYAEQIKNSATADLKINKPDKNFETEINKLKTWLKNRIAFLDEKLADYDTFMKEFSETINVLKLSDVSGKELNKDEIYHYNVNANDKVVLPLDTSKQQVEIWQNNQMIEKLQPKQNSYEMTIDQDSVIKLIYTDNNNTTSMAYVSVKVNELAITDYEFSAPTKLIYEENEALDLTGLKLVAVYEDQSKQEINDYSISGYDSSKVGKQTITVSYQDQSFTFEVELKAKASVTFNLDTLELDVNDSKELTYSVSDENEKVYFDIEDETIVKYQDNKVVGLNVGTTTIKVYLDNGNYDECIVTVNDIKMNFVDVKESDWFYGSVKKAYRKQLMGSTGKGPEYFEPNTSISRGMVATVLYRMANQPKVEFKATFSDVTNPKLWYSTAITWASTSGVVSGYKDGRFAPDDNITRQDLAIMLRNFAKTNGVDTSKVADLDKFLDDQNVDTYAKNAIAWCVEANIMSGSKTNEGLKLNPKANATRAECAKMFTLLEEYINIDK